MINLKRLFLSIFLFVLSTSSFASRLIPLESAASQLSACTTTGSVLSFLRGNVLQCGDPSSSKVTVNNCQNNGKKCTDALVSMYAPFSKTFNVFLTNLNSLMDVYQLSSQEKAKILNYINHDAFAEKFGPERVGSVIVYRPTQDVSAKYGNYIIEITKTE